MILVTVEIWPYGDRARREAIDTIAIANNADGTPELADYSVWRAGWAELEPELEKLTGRTIPPPDAVVRRHRRADGAAALVAKAIRALETAPPPGPLPGQTDIFGGTA